MRTTTRSQLVRESRSASARRPPFAKRRALELDRRRPPESGTGTRDHELYWDLDETLVGFDDAEISKRPDDWRLARASARRLRRPLGGRVHAGDNDVSKRAAVCTRMAA